jgi:hypothetical protein
MKKSKVLAHTTSLKPPPLIEVPVPSHDSKRPCNFVLGISILPVSTIFPLYYQFNTAY